MEAPDDGAPEVGAATAAIVGGADDIAPLTATSQARRDAVVQVMPARCTGTLITPRVVQTAYHCFNDGVPTAVVFGAVRDGSRWGALPRSYVVPVVACAAHPLANWGFRGAGDPPPDPVACGDGGAGGIAANDLVVVVLAERVELGRTTNFPAVPMRPRFDVDGDDVAARLVGFGSTLGGDDCGESEPCEGFPVLRQYRELHFDMSGGAWETYDRFSGHGDSGGPVALGDPDRTDLRIIGSILGERWRPFDHYGTGPVFADRHNREWLEPWLASMAVVEPPGGAPYRLWTGDLDVPPRDDWRRRTVAGASAIDPDGDGLGLVDGVQHDNCPLVYNPDQRDARENGGLGNGVGDADVACTAPDGMPYLLACNSPQVVDPDGDGHIDLCDNCPAVANADQGDCDGDLVGDACDDPDRDGDGVPDPCDACPDLAFTSRANSNLDGELADGAVPRGDPCDPSPVPSGAAQGRVVGDGAAVDDVVGGEGLITDATAASPLSATMRTGFRFCPCDIAADDPYRRQALCARPSLGGCIVDRDEYDRFRSPFRPMNLDFTLGEPVLPPGAPPDALTDEAILAYHRPALAGPGGTPTYEAVWDFRADTGPLGTGTLVADDLGRLSTRAVFWSVALDYAPLAGAAAACFGGPCPAPMGNLSSHYWSGPVEHVPGSLTRAPGVGERVALPRVPALLPPGPCPVCAASFPRPFLAVEVPPCGPTCPAPELRARVGAHDVLLTDRVEPALLAPLADPSVRWLAPSEPPELLGAQHPIRVLGVDAVTLAPREVVLADETLHRPLPPPQEKPPNDPPGAFPILRASRGELLIVGGEPAPPVLTRVDLATREVSALWLAGEPPEHVLAATLDANRPRLLVLDLVARGRGRRGHGPGGPDGRHRGARCDHRPGDDLRLLAVSLDTGRSTELLRRPYGRGPDHFALAAAPDGSFVLAASDERARRHVLLWLRVDGRGRIEVRGLLPAAGSVLGQVVAEGRGVSRAVLRRRGEPWALAGSGWGDFLPASRRDLEGALSP